MKDPLMVDLDLLRLSPSFFAALILAIVTDSFCPARLERHPNPIGHLGQDTGQVMQSCEGQERFSHRVAECVNFFADSTKNVIP